MIHTDSPTAQIEVIVLGAFCDECAVVVANDDASGVDEEREDEIRAGIGAIRRDEGGQLVITDPREDTRHLYRCACCGDDVMGYGWIGQVVRD